MAPDPTPDKIMARYLDLVDDLMGIEGVTPPPGGSGFGRGSLKYRGKIFAMLVRGSLVVKLPAERVTALIAAGEGVAFDANKGTGMREWFSLAPEAGLDWLALATEALEFGKSAAAGKPAPASGSAPAGRSAKASGSARGTGSARATRSATAPRTR